MKWHRENAAKVWGESAVGYAETQRHANRMKCRRAALAHCVTQGNANSEDEDEDVDCCPDAAPLGMSDKDADASAPHASPADPSAIFDGCDDRFAAEDILPSPRIILDTHSDPPGALRGYMNADSDVPAPAAPFADLAGRRADGGPLPGAKPSWMQPDPAMAPRPSAQGRSGPATEPGLEHLSWDSAFSVMGPGPHGDIISRSASCGPSGSCLDGAAERTCRPAKRQRDASAAADPSFEQRLKQPEPRPKPVPPPCLNPFAEVAAAAAAAAGRSTVKVLPAAARDAAVLLCDAAAATAQEPCNSARPSEPWVEPAWLQRAGAQLEVLMREMGLLAVDAGRSVALPGIRGKPRVLCSSAPLALPAPGPRRDLDGLLRRKRQYGACDAAQTTTLPAARPGLLCSARSAGGGATDPRVATGCTPAGRELGAGLLRCHGGGGGGGGDGGDQPLHGSLYGQARTRSESGKGPVGLMAIDCLPLEALL